MGEGAGEDDPYGNVAELLANQSPKAGSGVGPAPHRAKEDFKGFALFNPVGDWTHSISAAEGDELLVVSGGDSGDWAIVEAVATPGKRGPFPRALLVAPPLSDTGVGAAPGSDAALPVLRGAAARNAARRERRAEREAKRARNADREARRQARAVEMAAATVSGGRDAAGQRLSASPHRRGPNLGMEEFERLRAIELEEARMAQQDMFLLPLNLAEYDGLDQNFVGPDRIPSGVDHLNRYINILPNPRTRVRLTEINDDETSRYINANFVAGYDGTPGAPIAAQGPLPETVNDFWRMVWEKDSRVIVMVTGLNERGVVKCARYWLQKLYNTELEVETCSTATSTWRSPRGIGKGLHHE